MALKQWSLPTRAVPSHAVLLSLMLQAQWPLSGPKKPKSFTVTGPCGFSSVPSLFFPNSSRRWPSHSLGFCLNIIFFPKRYPLTFLIVGHCCYSLLQQCIYFLIALITAFIYLLNYYYLASPQECKLFDKREIHFAHTCFANV